MRLKIGRVAAAIAAQTLNLDNAGHLIVESPHIEAAKTLMRAIYDGDEMELSAYAALHTIRDSMDPATMRQTDDYLHHYEFRIEAYRAMLQEGSATNASNLADTLSIDKWEITQFISLCKHCGLVESKGRGTFALTPKGAQAAKRWIYELENRPEDGQYKYFNTKPKDYRVEMKRKWDQAARERKFIQDQDENY